MIRAAAATNAEIMGMAGRLGRIQPEAFADLIAVDGEPLKDLGLLQERGAHLLLILQGGRIVKTWLSA
jgi:imidazolonepropionase-like amidohydrolase